MSIVAKLLQVQVARIEHKDLSNNQLLPPKKGCSAIFNLTVHACRQRYELLQMDRGRFTPAESRRSALQHTKEAQVFTASFTATHKNRPTVANLRPTPTKLTKDLPDVSVEQRP